MKPNPNIDRRKYARLDLNSEIVFSVLDTKKTKVRPKRYHALGHNIGVAGLLFSFTKQINPGTLLNLEILLPNHDEPLFIQGEVKWCSPSKMMPRPKKKKGGKPKEIYDIGVNFVTIDKNHILLLIKHVCGKLEMASKFVDIVED